MVTVRSSYSALSELCSSIYLEKYRLGISSLFVYSSQCKRRVSCNTIYFWLQLVINHAYVYASDEDCLPLWVKAQEVWKIATSLLVRRNCAIHEVLKAVTWSSQSAFSSFYLRDVAHRHLDTFSIDPVVVA